MNNLLLCLHREKVITSSSLRSLEKFMKKWNKTAFHAALECNLLTENNMADILSRELKIDRVYNLNAKMIEFSALDKLPYRFALKYDAIPIRFLNTDILEVVVANPTDDSLLHELAKVTGYKIASVVSDLKSIRSLMHEVYPLTDQIPSLGSGE